MLHAVFTGQRVAEGAERAAAGGFHVQRFEEAGLRGRFPMALAVHRLISDTITSVLSLTLVLLCDYQQ